MFSLPFFQSCILLFVLFLAAAADLTSHRIPNQVLLAGGVGILLCRLLAETVPAGMLPALSAVQPAVSGISGADQTQMEIAGEASEAVLHTVRIIWPFLAAALAVFLFWPFYRRGMIGGGDVKLIALMLFAAPSAQGLRMLFYMFLSAAIVSVWRLSRRGRWRVRFLYLRKYLQVLVPAKCGQPYFDSRREGYEMTVPLGACAFAGVLAELLLCSMTSSGGG